MREQSIEHACYNQTRKHQERTMLIAYLERIRPERNEYRFYAMYFVDTLLGPAVTRVHGRKGAWARVLPPVFFPDLEAVQPYIARVVRRRTGHGYRLLFCHPHCGILEQKRTST